MKISVCLTVYNEERFVARTIETLLQQTHRPDEIVIVDGGSVDGTLDVLKHYQKKDKRIKLLSCNCSRSKGRNLSVDLARNEIIAMTDAGCMPNRDWLANITSPFETTKVDMVAGFYVMTGRTSFQKAASIFLGTTPRNFDINFLPSTRSVAFKKNLWEEVGGFPEALTDTAEDTVFNEKVIAMGAKIARVKNAVVEWGMPDELNEVLAKMYHYAKGDAKSGIWFSRAKGITSHNILIVSHFARYILFLGLIACAVVGLVSPTWPILIFLIYVFWSFRKVFVETGNVISGLYGIVIQFTSDFAVMAGFLAGI
jgi:glycosyltransferase involved in cell wall biosynthesis